MYSEYYITDYTELFDYLPQPIAEHSKRVGEFSKIIYLLALQEHTYQDDDLSPAYSHYVEQAGRFHDIGKVFCLPTKTAKNKQPQPFVDEAEHVKAASDMFFNMLNAKSDVQVAMCADAASNHHEWWNGGGVPSKLSGEAIPLVGRIVAVADTLDHLLFDNEANNKLFVKALDYTLISLNKFSGTKLDPKLCDLVNRNYFLIVGKYSVENSIYA